MPTVMSSALAPLVAAPSIGYGWVAGVLVLFAVMLVAVVLVAKAAEKSRRAAADATVPRRHAGTGDHGSGR